MLLDAIQWQKFFCRDTSMVNPFVESTIMPNAWSNKDERIYEHIKDSALERGQNARRAKEIAARTVNKQRREQGRTPNKTTQGTGNPNTPLEDRKVTELRNLASQRHIAGRSKMRKAQLIEALRSGK